MMKKLLCILILAGLVFANPVDENQIEINEFMFDEDGDWVLELKISSPFTIDSVMIYNPTDSAKILTIPDSLGTELGYFDYFVILSDSLSKALSFNKDGDHIHVCTNISYLDEYKRKYHNDLIYGDYENSQCQNLQDGYSIVRHYSRYCKDKTPSFGAENDTSGAMGTMQGYAYNKDGNIVTDLSVHMYLNQYDHNNFYTYNFKTDETGFYNTRVFATEFETDYLLNDSVYLRFDITPILFTMEPDSIVNCDIHLLTLGIEDESQNPDKMKISVTNYPNPFNPETTFKVQNLGQNDINKALINIYNIKGELVNSLILNSNAQTVWNGRNTSGKMMSAGVYVYRLMLSDNLKASGSMVLVK